MTVLIATCFNYVFFSYWLKMLPKSCGVCVQNYHQHFCAYPICQEDLPRWLQNIHITGDSCHDHCKSVKILKKKEKWRFHKSKKWNPLSLAILQMAQQKRSCMAFLLNRVSVARCYMSIPARYKCIVVTPSNLVRGRLLQRIIRIVSIRKMGLWWRS